MLVVGREAAAGAAAAVCDFFSAAHGNGLSKPESKKVDMVMAFWGTAPFHGLMVVLVCSMLVLFKARRRWQWWPSVKGMTIKAGV